MKRFLALLACFLLVTLARGAEWPPLFEEFEKEALRQPSDLYARQLWLYAAQAERVGEMRERWQAKSGEPDGWRYRCLLGRLAELRQEPERAREEYGRVTTALPEEPEGWLLLGGLEAAEKSEAARPALEKAVALASRGGDPGQAITRLAEDHLQHGRAAEALAAYLSGWRSPGSAQWSALVTQGVQLALTLHRLPEVLAGFEKTPRSDLETSALAMAYVALKDEPLAAEILRRARAEKPDNVPLLEASLTVARGTLRFDERRELRRQSARLAPTSEHYGELLNELAGAGAETAEEMRALLKEHPRELAETAARWRARILMLQRLELTAETKAALGQLPESWEATLAFAECQLAERDFTAAQETLWKVFGHPAEPVQSTSLLQHSRSGLSPLVGQGLIEGSSLGERFALGHPLLQELPPLLQPQGGMGSMRSRAWSGRPRFADELYTLSEVRDRALLYLFLIARETKQLAAFTERLTKVLAPYPAADRVFWWSLIDAPAPLVAAIESWAAEPGRTATMDAYCRTQLQLVKDARGSSDLAVRAGALLASLPPPQPAPSEVAMAADGTLAPADLQRLQRTLRTGAPTKSAAELRAAGWPLTEESIGRISKAHPDVFRRITMPGGFPSMDRFAPDPQSLPKTLSGLGLAAAPADPPTALASSASATIAFSKGDFAQALAAFREAGKRDPASSPLPNPIPPVPTGMSMTLHNFAKSPDQVLEGIVTLAECLAILPLAPPGVEGFSWDEALRTSNGFTYSNTSAFWPGSRTRFGEGNLPILIPPKMLLPENEAQIWRELWVGADELKIWPAIKQRLQERASRLPESEAQHMKTGLCYLQWWSGELDEAEKGMRQLLAETGSDGCRLALAGMMNQRGKIAEAIAMLGQMPLPYPGFRRFVAAWQLRLQTEAGDAAGVAALAKELKGAPLDSKLATVLSTELEKAGFMEEAAQFREPEPAAPVKPADLNAALQVAVSAGDTAAMAKLARDILAAPFPASDPVGFKENQRRSALAALDKAGVRAAYADELEKLQPKQPSVEFLLRRAEAATDADVALDLYREELRLEPRNAVAARHLLFASQNDEQTRMTYFEVLLAADPVAALNPYNFRVTDLYFRRQEVPRLAARLSEVRLPPFSSVGNQPPLEGSLISLSQKMRQAAEPASAAVALKKAADLAGSLSPVVRRNLLSLLPDLDPGALQGLDVVDILLPDPAPSGLRRGPGPGYPMGFMSGREDLPVLFDARVVQKARDAGFGPALLERARHSTAPLAKATAAYLRVLDRDASVLPEVRSTVAALEPNATVEPSLIAITEELAAWPEAGETCRQALKVFLSLSKPTRSVALARAAAVAGEREVAIELIRRLLKTPEQSNDASVQIFADALVFAITLNDPALIGEGGKSLTALFRQSATYSSAELETAVRAIAALLDFHRPEQAAAFLKTLEETTTLPGTAAAFAAEIGLQVGTPKEMTPVVWIDPAHSTASRAALVWDLGLPREGDDAPLVRGESSAQMGEDWKVELRFGETADHPQLLAKISETGWRGHWQGHLPARTGWLSAVFVHGDERLEGKAFPFVLGPNLIQPEPAATAQKTGGPTLDEEYQALPKGDRGRTTVTVAGPPIKLKPGSEYELSGWLRTGLSPIRVAVRYLDQNKNAMGISKPDQPVPRREETAGTARWWRLFKTRLHFAPGTADPGIPPEAAYAEPVIVREKDSGDVAGFSLVQVP